MPSNRFGLQGRVIIIIAATVVSVVGVSTYIATLLTRIPVEEDLYRKALQQARLVAHQLVDQGALQDPDRLQSVLRQFEHDSPGVKQSDVYLHDPHPHLVTTTNPHGEHLELDQIRNIRDYNEFEQPDEDQLAIETPAGDYWIIGTAIRDPDGRSIGCLDLKVSKSRLNAITWDLVVRNLLVMLASLAVVIMVIHLFFLRRVRSPIREMIRVMEATEGGQLHPRARVAGGDEIGQLAEHLNLMLDRIENFSSELAHKVEEATSELALRNEELKSINEELFETQKNLARSERLAVAGQLAAGLAHEIGTPLNSISGHVQLLARRKALDEGSQRRLQIIEGQIENIVRTVKQLLSWTRKFDLRIVPIDLRRVIKESIMVSSPALQQRRIKAQMDLPRDGPPVYGDAGYLQQVFLNLINNSMDAMPEGGELRVRLRYAPGGLEPASNAREEVSAGAGQEVVVEFSDTGHGINPETLGHIFEPMFTTKRMGTGAGLGLAICDQIIRQHGGAIRVESELHRGTMFTITLPLDSRQKAETAASPGAGAVVGSRL
ncbi:MAG TPA: ATP-binding protein [Terriglobia bacterium]|nr:ATP-binding protein [Terriglobia bacterium]